MRENEVEGVQMEIGFRIDLLVENLVIVELKSVEATAPVHYKQLLTYLRLADKRVGLLLNFGAATIKEGITRVVNALPE
jgi:GxxExxY protein